MFSPVRLWFIMLAVMLVIIFIVSILALYHARNILGAEIRQCRVVVLKFGDGVIVGAVNTSVPCGSGVRYEFSPVPEYVCIIQDDYCCNETIYTGVGEIIFSVKNDTIVEVHFPEG